MDGGTRVQELGSDEHNAPDVLVVVLRRVAELGGRLGAHGLAEEERDAARTLLVQHDLQRRAGVVQPSEEEVKALIVAGRIGFVEGFHTELLRSL